MRPHDLSTQNPESLMYQILRLKEEIDHVASKLKKNNGVFGSVSLRFPIFFPSELGFLRTVSWLYVMYYEVGKVDVNFLIERFSVYNINSYLFSWDEIPGEDNEKLIEFLIQNFGTDWVKTAKIEKIDDEKTIRLSEEKNFLSLRLNNEKTKINLEIDDVRNEELTVQMENGKLNLYFNEKNYLSLILNDEKIEVNLKIDDGRTDKFIAMKKNGKLKVYDNKLSKHLLIVQQLRTFLQHNLDPKEHQNLVIQEACEQWLKKRCGTPIPEDDPQWKICLIHILNEAIDLFSALRTCIRSIEQDESREQILHEWDFLRKRYHPPHEFDNLISKVAADMGREKIDAVRLRKRFYEEWVKQLELLQGNYGFEVEARKLIENVLLYKITPVLPITGKDIIKEFNISPGPEVGKFLERARKLYSVEPCSRDELLKRLRLEKD